MTTARRGGLSTGRAIAHAVFPSRCRPRPPGITHPRSPEPALERTVRTPRSSAELEEEPLAFQPLVARPAQHAGVRHPGGILGTRDLQAEVVGHPFDKRDNPRGVFRCPGGDAPGLDWLRPSFKKPSRWRPILSAPSPAIRQPGHGHLRPTHLAETGGAAPRACHSRRGGAAVARSAIRRSRRPRDTGHAEVGRVHFARIAPIHLIASLQGAGLVVITEPPRGLARFGPTTPKQLRVCSLSPLLSPRMGAEARSQGREPLDAGVPPNREAPEGRQKPCGPEDVCRPYLLDICPTASSARKKAGRTACFRRLIRTICCPAARHMSGSPGLERRLRGSRSIIQGLTPLATSGRPSGAFGTDSESSNCSRFNGDKQTGSHRTAKLLPGRSGRIDESH